MRLIFILAFVLSASYSHAKSDVCEGRLISVADVREWFDQENKTATVRNEGDVDFELGGKLFVLKKVGRFWFSRHASSNTDDPQGDPRTPVLLLGAPVAHFLGFREIDAKTMTVPNFEAANLALNLINAEMQSPIPVRFYPEENLAGLDDYIRQFSQLKLPLSGSAHDHSYHFSIITIHPDDLKFVESQIVAAAEFMDWLNVKMPKRSWISGFIRTYSDFLHAKIDMSGDLTSAFAIKSVMGGTYQNEFYDQLDAGFEYFFSNGQSPRDYVETTARMSLENMLRSGYPVPESDVAEFKQVLKAFHQSKGAEYPRWLGFLNSSKSGEYTRSRSDLKNNRKNLTAFVQRVNQRRSEIALATVKAKQKL